MKFEAEVIEVKAKKSITQVDKVIRIILETNQPIALGLQEYIAEKSISVEVKE